MSDHVEVSKDINYVQIKKKKIRKNFIFQGKGKSTFKTFLIFLCYCDKKKNFTVFYYIKKLAIIIRRLSVSQDKIFSTTPSKHRQHF